MHKLKRAARYESWDSDEDRQTTLNPFASPNDPRRGHTSDTELNQVITAHSEPDLHSDAAIRRTTDPLELPTALLSSEPERKQEPRLELISTHARKRAPAFGFRIGHWKRKDIESRKRQKFTIWSQFRYTIFNSWLNVLLVFVPAGFAVQYTYQEPIVIFAINFIATVPSAFMLGVATDELQLRTGDLVGPLVNITFSNAVQLITSIFLLRSNQIPVLQTSLVGSILSNMHLMLGLGFLAGGENRIVQHFNSTVARLLGTMLLLAMASIIIPTVIKLLPPIDDQDVSDASILSISRGVSIILLIIYGFFLYFQLKTHIVIFEARGEKAPKRRVRRLSKGAASRHMVAFSTPLQAFAGATMADEIASGARAQDIFFEEEEKEEPQMSLTVVIATMLIYTTLVGFNVAFATDSLQGMTQSSSLTDSFVGIVLLPLLSVDWTSLQAARKDNMDKFIAVTVGKFLQTALLIIPFIVMLGWMINVPMSLEFDGFEVAALFASVLYINSMIQEGASTYLTGILLLGLFAIICLASYFVHY